MTIETANRSNLYTGNDSATEFAYTYRVIDASHLEVIRRNADTSEDILVLDTDYTVSGVSDQNGGNVTYPISGSPLTSSERIFIKRKVPQTQLVDLLNNGPYFAQTHEDVFDYVTMMVLQMQEELDRAPKVDPTSGLTGDQLIDFITQAVIDAQASAAAAAVSESNAATSEANAATSETNAATSETNAANSASAASTSETNAANSASAAATSESNAAASALAASDSANDAANSAAAATWSDVVFATFASSPISVVDTDAGTLYSIDTSGGNVVVNLEEIANLTLSGPWRVGFKKTSMDSNTITINRGGTDTIDGSASVVISEPMHGLTLVPDLDPTPDEWTSIGFGELPTDVIREDNTKTMTNKTFDDEITMQEIAEPATPAAGYQAIYVDQADGKVKQKDDAGNVSLLGGGVGSPSIYAVYDAEDKVLTGFVNISINETTPIDQGADYEVDSFPANFPLVNLNERNKNKFNSVRFHYSLASGSFKVLVKDQASNVLAEKVISDTGTGKPDFMDFPVFVSETGVRFHIEDDSSATGVFLDDVVFDDDPFSLENLTQTNSFKETGNSSEVVGLGTATPFGSANNKGWDGDQYTIQSSDSVLFLKFSTRFTATGNRVYAIYKNGSQHQRINNTNNDSIHSDSYISKKGEFNAGDTISIRLASGSGTLFNGDSVNHYINIVEQWQSPHYMSGIESTVSDWEDAGQLTIEATTSNPTKGTTDKDIKRCRRVGDSMEIGYIFSQTASGSAGSGDYLFSIPTECAGMSGLTIDSSKVEFMTAVEGSGNFDLKGTRLGEVSSRISGDNYHGSAIAYDSTRFRLFVTYGTAQTAIHSGQGGLNNTVIQYSIRIVVPITQWSSNGKFLGSVPENYTQTKILSSNISSTQDVADIQFNNLIIGKNYEIGGTVRSEATAGTAELNAYSASGGGGTLYGVVHQNSNSNAPTIEVGYGANVKFKAVSSTLYLRFTTATSESLIGDGTKNGTFITLSELNFTKETTRFL